MFIVCPFAAVGSRCLRRHSPDLPRFQRGNAMAEGVVSNPARIPDDPPLEADTCCDEHREDGSFKDLSGPLHAPPGGEMGMGEQIILTRRDRYDALYLYGSLGMAWTSNAALTDSNELSDIYLLASVDLAYRPELSRNLFADVELSYDAHRYESYSSLDTDQQDVRIGVIRSLPQVGGLNLFAHYTYDRLIDGRQHDELYASHGVQVGLDKRWALTPHQAVYLHAYGKFSLDSNTTVRRGETGGDEGSDKKKDPRFSARSRKFLQNHEYSLYLSHQYHRGRFDVETYYRLQFFDFRYGGRHDLSHTFGFLLRCRLTDAASLLGGISGTINDSNERDADYEAIDGGASLALQLHF